MTTLNFEDEIQSLLEGILDEWYSWSSIIEKGDCNENQFGNSCTKLCKQVVQEELLKLGSLTMPKRCCLAINIFKIVQVLQGFFEFSHCSNT